MKVFIQYTFLLYIIFFKLVVSEAAELPDMEKYVAETGAQVKAIIQENNRLIEIGAGVTGTYLVDKCLATDGIATLTTTIATSYNESLFEKYNGDVLIIIHIIYPEGQGGKKDVLDSTLLYSQRITSLLDPQKTKTTVHFWQVVNHEADQLYSFEHVIEASNINPIVAFDYEAIKLQVTSCSNLVCSIGAYAGIGGTTSTSGLNALYAKNENINLLETSDDDIPTSVVTFVTIKFLTIQNVKTNDQTGLREAFAKMLNDPFCRSIFSKAELSDNALLDHFLITQKWHWQSDFVISANEDFKVSFTYRELWSMTAGLNNARDALLQYIYGLYPGPENAFIQTDILVKYKNRYSNDLDQILRIAAVAKLLGKEKWDAYPIILTAQTSNFSDYFDALYAYYKAYSKFDQILACNSPGTGSGQMTFIMRTLSASDYTYLPVQHRIHALEVMSTGMMWGKMTVGQPMGEEDIFLKIFHTTADNQVVALLNGFRKNKYALLQRLFDKVDNDDFEEFVHKLTLYINQYKNELAISVTTKKSMTFNNITGLSSVQYAVGANPFYIGFDKGTSYCPDLTVTGSTYVYCLKAKEDSEVSFENGKINFVQNYTVQDNTVYIYATGTTPATKNSTVSVNYNLDPFEPVNIHFSQSYISEGLFKGQTYIVPAIWAMIAQQNIDDANFWTNLRKVGNAVEITAALLSFGESLTLSSGIRIFSGAVAVADDRVQVFERKMSAAQYEENKSFLAKWNTIYTLSNVIVLGGGINYGSLADEWNTFDNAMMEATSSANTSLAKVDKSIISAWREVKNSAGTATVAGNFAEGIINGVRRYNIAGEIANGVTEITRQVTLGNKSMTLKWNVVNGVVDFTSEAAKASLRSQIKSFLGIPTGAGVDAHHILSLGKCDHPVVQSAAKNGYHPNLPESIIGLEHYDEALQVGLHQNHPAYDKFIEFRLNEFMSKGNMSNEVCNDFIQKQLIPELKREIFNAKNSSSGNLNTYFKDVINPNYNIY